MIRSVLAKDPDEPICGDCAVAFSHRPLGKIATASLTKCAVCSNERHCFAIRDYEPPAAASKRESMKDWKRPLGRRA